MKISGIYKVSARRRRVIALAMSFAALSSIAAVAQTTPKGWPTPTPVGVGGRPASSATADPGVVTLPKDMNQKYMDGVLQRIRVVFRSHRPPPLYESYTMTRQQNTEQGYPDYAESYTYHVWVRNSDDAAVQRQVQRGDARGPMQFLRPYFNADEDPGPPTVDVFQQAPLRHTTPVATPEPGASQPPVIAVVVRNVETQYRVWNLRIEGDMLHVSVVPYYDVDRNRLREIYVDKKTLEMRRMIATDKLFIEGTPDVYPVTFYAIFGRVNGIPVVTDIHGVVGGGYTGDGQNVDYYFKDVAFPSTLPEWYFNPRAYAQHQGDDAPQ
jgi:hypothetical protein